MENKSEQRETATKIEVKLNFQYLKVSTIEFDSEMEKKCHKW